MIIAQQASKQDIPEPRGSWCRLHVQMRVNTSRDQQRLGQRTPRSLQAHILESSMCSESRGRRGLYPLGDLHLWHPIPDEASSCTPEASGQRNFEHKRRNVLLCR
jgi:hypothetical protein